MQLVKNKLKQIKQRRKLLLKKQLQLRKLLLKRLQLLKNQAQVQVQVQVNQEVKDLQEDQQVERVEDLNQADLNLEDLSQEVPKEVLSLQVQEDKAVERQVEQKEVASVVREGKATLRNQGEGAILGVSLISQYLQIRI